MSANMKTNLEETVLKCQAWLLAATCVISLAGSIFNGFYVGNYSSALWALSATLSAVSGAVTSWRLANLIAAIAMSGGESEEE